MTKAMEEGEIEAKKAKAERLIDKDSLYIQLQERMQMVQDKLDRSEIENICLKKKLVAAEKLIKELEAEALPVPNVLEDDGAYPFG